ncbi:MAG: dNTP triphosphohydrolase [Muribaculaceae bacterium]|nr:dNTP triphosphohydrolase [Muribaculaceae bacterium]MDE6331065.1 dNTP triphosphohydrolase [Muribaculaceae bacterium]
MEWNKLISDKRFGLEHYHDPKKNATRTDFRRDYDRLVFSSPFRRLQNKTQVFPLPGSIFVHNRLTHSMEVACVGKSLADNIAQALRERYASESWVGELSHLGDIVAAACLAHDLGNPPFGHSGEKAIGTYFSEGAGSTLRDRLSVNEWSDFINFEGNANAFRILTHQFNGRREGGFAMTYSTLASVVKYPYESVLAGSKGKFGFFCSETDSYLRVAEELGLKRISADGAPLRYARHPLVYIVEAADDICYEVMDLEDAHKLRIITTAEVTELLLAFFEPPRRDRIVENMLRVDDPNEQVAYLRSCVIGALVGRCAECFLENESRILSGDFQGSLLKNISGTESEAYAQCNELSMQKIYCASDVVDIELAGNRIITFLLEKLVDAVTRPELNYSKLLLSQVPRQYDVSAPTLYGRLQAVVDHVSAMTDVYALNLYRKLNGSTLPAV